MLRAWPIKPYRQFRLVHAVDVRGADPQGGLLDPLVELPVPMIKPDLGALSALGDDRRRVPHTVVLVPHFNLEIIRTLETMHD